MEDIEKTEEVSDAKEVKEATDEPASDSAEKSE